MSEVALISAIRPGRAEPLRRKLRALRRDGGPSPFAGRRTHFARLVVIELDAPRLLFTARFDGREDSYLSEIAHTAAALEVWGECEIGDQDTAAAVLAHLRDPRLRVPAGYVISLLKPGVSVPAVRAALELRRELSAFAAHTQALAPVEVAHRFAELPAVRRARSR